MHILSSCVFFHKEKRTSFAVLNISLKTSLCCYTNQIASLLLSLTELILLAINIGTSNMTKNIKSQNGCTSFIYFRTLRKYTSSLSITVPMKVLTVKIWGLTPLNRSFMTELGLKVVISRKTIYAVEVKHMSWFPWHDMAISWQLRKKIQWGSG